MSDLTDVCQLCNTDAKTQFQAGTGLRQHEIISTDLLVDGPCFVRDIIEFRDAGRLIFKRRTKENRDIGYFPEYSVICRQLIINGGNKPITLNPCNPGDPGTRYSDTNLITWLDRLHVAPGGPPPSPTPPQTSLGVPGTNGADGSQGHAGIDAPPKLVLVALTVDVQNNGHLVIDWGGQDGGDGGKGQNGGQGGKGAKGSNGSNESWPGSGCDNSTGDGGQGAQGGTGGKGGLGANGGKGGATAVISTLANIKPGGVFTSPAVQFVNDGGVGGKGGKGGFHGQGGPGGPSGTPTNECPLGSKGPDGLPGDDGADQITPGVTGLGGGFSPQKVDAGTCADLIPMPMVFDAIATPIRVCRCFSGSGSGDISITGQFLDQVDTVTCSISGVTITKKLTSTASQLDLKVQISAASGTGVGNLVFKPVLGPNQTLNNAIDIEKCQVTAIVPNSIARGATVGVTITGVCFDPTGSFHDVVISGLGVDAVNIAVVDDQTMTCQLQANAGTATGLRDVTVKAGDGLSPCQHVLVNGLTIT